MEVIATLPYPLTVNKVWQRKGNAIFLHPSIKFYRQEVWSIFYHKYRFLDARLKIHVDVFPPDNRKRDIDNLLKSILDSLQHAGVYEDDSQIDEISIKRCAQFKSGKVDVSISDIT